MSIPVNYGLRNKFWNRSLRLVHAAMRIVDEAGVLPKLAVRQGFNHEKLDLQWIGMPMDEAKALVG